MNKRIKSIIATVTLILTTITGLFAEGKWNINYRVRTVTDDEFYATVTVNPCWQEYDWWIDEDHDNIVDYMEDTISDENFIGTDEDGTSYYADEDGNIAAVFSDGTVTTENANDDSPDPDDYDGVVETLNTDTSREYTFDDNGNLVDSDTGEQVDTSDWNDVIGVATEQDGKTTPVV